MPNVSDMPRRLVQIVTSSTEAISLRIFAINSVQRIKDGVDFKLVVGMDGGLSHSIIYPTNGQLIKAYNEICASIDNANLSLG